MRTPVLFLVPVMFAAFSAFADLATSNGVTYFVPDAFVSANELLLDERIPVDRRLQLERQIDAMEESFGTVIDYLLTPEQSEQKGGVFIFLEPVEADDPTDAEYMDDVFDAMLRMASHLEDPAEQNRRITDPTSADDYYRMDVSNAYGTAGQHASFLSKKVGNQYLMLILVTDSDPYAGHFNAVVESLSVDPSDRRGAAAAKTK